MAARWPFRAEMAANRIERNHRNAGPLDVPLGRADFGSLPDYSYSYSSSYSYGTHEATRSSMIYGTSTC
eukprot:scaffold302604_cov25-Prasinocladus_malaysianus.AAC.3